MLSNNPTKQEVLNHIIIEMRKQGKMSATEHGTCKYRHEGLKCAVGHCIPDHLYKKEMDEEDNTSILAVIERDLIPAELSWMKDSEMKLFLTDLQRCHDGVYSTSLDPIGDFEDHVQRVIAFADLTIPPKEKTVA